MRTLTESNQPIVKSPMRYLAFRRICYYKSSSILTAIAVILTACLLMSVGTIATGMVKQTQASIDETAGNYHARLANVTWEQLEVLKNHAQVESLSRNEIFASVEKDKMNASIGTYADVLPGIHNSIELTQGVYPAEVNEIAGPPAFFERLGYDNPQVGDLVEVSYRVQGEGEIIVGEFEITGLVKQRDISNIDVADTRIVYSALISEALVNTSLQDKEHLYQVYLRLKGEENYNSTQLMGAIEELAISLGVEKTAISENYLYMMWMVDPAVETMVGIIAISALVIFFAGMVIYSIYYVSVISNVKELGKLKAIGAGRKQMRSLLLWEGILISMVSIPIGLFAGYILSHFTFHLLYSVAGLGGEGSIQISLFSLPVVIFSIVCTLITVTLSLRRPMKMASGISPIEALRYREAGTDKKADRNGYFSLNTRKLAFANLSRNRRRSMVTIISMGLGGILFLAISTVTSSMNEEDYLRQYLTRGDFKLALRYSMNDEIYPENNLDSLQMEGLLGDAMIRQLLAIPGLEKIEGNKEVLSYIEHPSEEFEAGKRITVGAISREEFEELDIKKGSGDYDELLKNNGMVFTSDYFFELYGVAVGEEIGLTLIDGTAEKSLKAVLMTSTDTNGSLFLIPEELFDKLVTNVAPASHLYIYAEEGRYDEVKAALNEIVEQELYFSMMSYDEEYRIAASSMDMMRYAVYILIAVLGFIVFINFINTMITSIVTRRKELAFMQAVGMSNKQLGRMLQWEGGAFTIGTLMISIIVGNAIGYAFYRYCVENKLMGIKVYHYPVWQTLLLFAVLVGFQYTITHLLTRKVKKESLVERMRR